MCPRLLYQGARIIAGYFGGLRKLIASRNIAVMKINVEHFNPKNNFHNRPNERNRKPYLSDKQRITPK